MDFIFITLIAINVGFFLIHASEYIKDKHKLNVIGMVASFIGGLFAFLGIIF